MTTRMHSPAHVSEVAYRAVRKALFPDGYPQLRDRDGRFVSRLKSTTERLRSEQAALHNLPLEEAIELQRARG
jgi:hypothetical protein